MGNKHKERDKLAAMVKARKGGMRKRPIVGLYTPVELRTALIKAGPKKPDTGFHVLLLKKQRTAFNKLAKSMDIPAAELTRVLLDTATTLGSDGVRAFVAAANKLEDDPEAKFEKARPGDKRKKRRSVLDDKPELDDGEDEDDESRYVDDGEPEEDDDEDDDEDEDKLEADRTGEPTPQLKRKKKKQKTGASRPEKSLKTPKDGRPGSLS